jgi:hypothetical protein
MKSGAGAFNVKETMPRQKELDLPSGDPLEEIRTVVLREKEAAAELKKRVKGQGLALREAAGLLGEIHTALFEIRQGELFDEWGADGSGGEEDTECKNEVFEELRGLLGAEQAEKVADYFSGSLVYFSKSIAVARKYREIRKAFREGAGYRDLGVKYGYTETHIRRIVHGGKNK